MPPEERNDLLVWLRRHSTLTDAQAAHLMAAAGDENLLPLLREALRAYCTVGELCETLREEWGMYDALRARA